MKTRNKIINCIVVVLVLLLFVSCGGSEENPATTTYTDNPRTTTKTATTATTENVNETFNLHPFGNDVVEKVSVETTSLAKAIIVVGKSSQVSDRASRIGYTFEGAYSLPNGNGLQIFNADGSLVDGIILTDGMEVYCVWNIKSYQIIFKNGDKTYKTLDCSYGQIYEKFDIVYKDGYIFDGWYLGITRVTNEYGYLLPDYQAINEKYGLNDASSSITLEAKFDIMKYDVVFDYLGYENSVTIEVEHGSKLESLPNVGKEYLADGVELLGWSTVPGSTQYYDISNKIVGNITLYAVYRSFKDYDLISDGSSLGKLRVYAGETIKLEDVKMNIPQGYSLVDAYTQETMSGSSKVTTISAYLFTDKLYIKLEPITYNITYSLESNEEIIESEYPTTFDCEIEVTLPTVTKEHCIFLGWVKKEGDTPYQIGKSIRLNAFEDVTLYPSFKGENALLHIIDYDNESESKDVYSEYGKKVSLEVPLDPNYKFAGYYITDDEGKEVQYTDEHGVGLSSLNKMELTLKAHWNKKLHITATSSPEGLVEIKTNEFYVKGEQAILKVTTPKFYTFAGWREMDNSGSLGEVLSESLSYKFILSERNYHLVATFEPEVYTVKLSAGQGVICIKNEVNISYGATFTLPIAAKEGYLFEGWYEGETQITDGDGNGLSPWTSGNTTLVAKLTESADGYILIRNAEELTRIKVDTTRRFCLTNDITITEWEPGSFAGTLNGSGFTISGLTTALFTELSGNVMNIKIMVNIENTPADTTNIGGLANIFKSGTISNVEISGSVQAGGASVGGLVGKRESGSIKNSINNVTVIGGANNVGGFVGWAIGSGLSITNSINNGDVTGKNYTGGFIGLDESVAPTLTYLANNGNITGEQNTGGIIGLSRNNVIAATYVDLINNGSVVGKDYVGGIAGQLYQSINSGTNYSFTLKTLINKGNITGENYTAGIVGYLKADNICVGYYAEHYWIQTKAASLINEGNVKGTQCVGGIFGYIFEDSAATGELVDSSSKGIIEALYKVGGLIGWMDNYINVNNCSNTGSTIKATSYFSEDSNFSVYLGGYVGRGGAIQSCKNEANIEYTEKGRFVGGIIGYSYGYINDCSNTGNINAPNASYVGGIFGYNTQGAVGFAFSSLNNEGDITGYNYVGGIAGQIYQNINTGNNYTNNLKNLTNKGNITGKDCTAGIIGYLKTDNINVGYYAEHYWVQTKTASLVNEGNVKGTQNVGGIFGYVYEDPDASGELVDSSSRGNIEAEYKVGGLIGWIDNNFDIKNCSNAGSTVKATSYLTEDSSFSVYLGGYVGRGGYIYNCNNEINIEYTEKGRFVGGIVGYSFHQIINCSNTGNINAPNASYIGGLVGKSKITGIANYTFSSLSNEGDITGYNNVGGIAGEVYQTFSYNSNFTTTFKDLTNIGNISGKLYTAGIVGFIRSENTYDSYYTVIKASNLVNEANVTGTQFVGGIFGYVYEDPHATGELLDGSSKGNIEALYYVGGLIGLIDNYFDIKNCSNAGSNVKATSFLADGTNYSVYLGGYVGRGGSFYNCKNELDIDYNQKGNYVGGIAGYSSGHIVGCSNTGNINAPKSSYVGGLVGANNFGSINLSFSDSNNNGDVTGENYVGGLVGQLYQSFTVVSNYTDTFKTLTNKGKIIGKNYAAGIIGYLKADNTRDGYYVVIKASNLINEANVTGTQNVGGIFGYVYEDPEATGELIDSLSKGNIVAEYKVGGLIGYIDNGINIKNCSNADSTVKATSYFTDTDSRYKVYLGGYVGRGGYFYDITNDIEINYDQKGDYVGGIAGYGYPNFVNCINNANVYAPKSHYVGGFAGAVDFGAGNETFENATNKGNITGRDYTAGIVGYLYNVIDTWGDFTCKLKNIENTGAIKGEKFTAGIIGYIKQEQTKASYYTVIKASEVTNEADITGTQYVGGIFGYVFEDSNTTGELIDSSSKGNILAEYKVGGLIGWIDNGLNIKNCSNEGSTVKATSYLTDTDSKYKVYLGGYVGRGGYFYDITNDVDIDYDQKGNYVGGIAGVSSTYLVNCTNNGNINAPKSNYVGGLVGIIDGCVGNETFENLKNTGDVTGKDYTAGIIGYLYNSFTTWGNHTCDLKKLENSGKIKGKNYTAGIIGYIKQENTYNTFGIQIKALDCKNICDINGDAYVGGLFGYAFGDPEVTGEIRDCTVKCTIVYSTGNAGAFAGKIDNTINVVGDDTVNEATVVNAADLPQTDPEPTDNTNEENGGETPLDS